LFHPHGVVRFGIDHSGVMLAERPFQAGSTLKRTLTLFALIALCACSKTPGGATTANAATPAAAPQSGAAPPAGALLGQEPAKPVPAQLPDVLARVNGEAVNKAEFDRAVSALEARNGGPVPAQQRDRIFRDVLDQIVSYKLLTQESKARQIAASDMEVDERMKEIQAQFPSEDAFKQMLTSRKTTIEQVRGDIRQDLTVQKLITSAIADKVAVKPEQVTDFYAKNPDQFKQPERVRASHILITVPKDADPAAKNAARTKAADILKDVKAGKDFAALAKQHSQDPGSGQNGGDLGFFQQGQMVGPFNDVAFKLAPGQVSELVETEFGFHIIKVVEKQVARTVPLDEVRPRLEQYLERMNREQETDAFVNGLKTRGKIEILI
jgi:peptidyl-prolyl cis-trans isomerase C